MGRELKPHEMKKILDELAARETDLNKQDVLVFLSRTIDKEFINPDVSSHTKNLTENHSEKIIVLRRCRRSFQSLTGIDPMNYEDDSAAE